MGAVTCPDSECGHGLASLGGSKLVGESLGDRGLSVASPGDVDGDGFGEVLLGAYDSDAGGASSGAAYLVSGRSPGTPACGCPARLVGEQPADLVVVAAPGDFDGDGLMDILVGALEEDTGGAQAGAVYLRGSRHRVARPDLPM